MHAPEFWIEKRPLEMQPERPRSGGGQTRTLRDLPGGVKHLIPRARHDRWQECCDAMRGSVGAQRFERFERIAVEPRAAHAVDMKVDEPRRHRASDRKF